MPTASQIRPRTSHTQHHPTLHTEVLRTFTPQAPSHTYLTQRQVTISRHHLLCYPAGVLRWGVAVVHALSRHLTPCSPAPACPLPTPHVLVYSPCVLLPILPFSRVPATSRKCCAQWQQARGKAAGAGEGRAARQGREEHAFLKLPGAASLLHSDIFLAWSAGQLCTRTP